MRSRNARKAIPLYAGSQPRVIVLKLPQRGDEGHPGCSPPGLHNHDMANPNTLQVRADIESKLRRHFGCELAEASREELFKACSLVMRDRLAARYVETENRIEENRERQVHYLSLEFLMGRSFLNNAYNLGMLEVMRDTLREIGVDFPDFLETEPDAGLGNGGLGRLAACYLDAMATLGLAATGYSIRYEHGLFKQRIVEGQQIELPDSWLDIGDVWLIPRMDEVQEVRFGGSVDETWENGRMKSAHRDFTPVLAIPYDMLIAGYGTENICTLRLWSAKSPVELDMSLFSRGEYLKAVEQHAMAEVISKILYPDDKHIEGKSLRLKQQYFFVSATIQHIVKNHRPRYGTLRSFSDRHVIHINDTHPTLVVPELMRILLDEEGYNWDDAWDIVTHAVAYTNHTVMAEALEQWPQTLFESLMPRIHAILVEINERYCRSLWARFPGDFALVSRMSVLCDGMLRMANLAVVSSFSVNGVSALHSEILKNTIFNDYYKLTPEKFTNVTNGIAHRRWLCEANPRLSELIASRIGDDFLRKPSALSDFARYADDPDVQGALAAIKRENKVRLAAYIAKRNCVSVDPDSIFDVQVKRLHEYKRQLMNVLQILDRYLAIKENPNGHFTPRTCLFGAKAFPGYYAAKQIIRLINSVSCFLEKDAAVRDLLRVVFLENYRVTLAELVMPSAELSEQISTAGKEASGTGNMKFMINGALTIGTMDGANVEIHESVGDENMFLFGLRSEEIDTFRQSYNPAGIYQNNARLRGVLDLMNRGFGDGVSYHDLVSSLLVGASPDPYLLLADFDAYCEAQRRVDAMYADPARWNRSSALNIAGSGRFAADRAVYDYATKIWHVPARYEV